MKKKENSTDIIKRIIKISILTQAVIILVIFLFTKKPIYIIITLLASFISVSGFLLMIKLIDRILSKGKGKGLFFIAGFFKLIFITVIFYFISKISESAILFYILGLSIVVISIIFESGYQLLRKTSNGT